MRREGGRDENKVFLECCCVRSFAISARVNHVLEHLAGSVPPHTVTLKEGEADEKDIRHWMVDYHYYLRLARLFPTIKVDTTELHSVFGKAIFTNQQWQQA